MEGTKTKNKLATLVAVFLISTLAMTMRMPEAEARLTQEIAYDDGTAEYGCSGPTGHQIAVKFSLPSGWSEGRLLTARYYIRGAAVSFKVHIYGSDGTTELISSFEVTPTSTGWFDVDLSTPDLTVTEDFYITIEYEEDNHPKMGEDTTAPDNRSYGGAPGGWYPITGYDVMIRAVVQQIIPVLSALAPTPPTIDGTLGPDEWDAADTETFTIGERTSTIYVMNDANNLYIALEIPDTTEHVWDGCYVYFDNDNDGVRENGEDCLKIGGSPPGNFVDLYYDASSSTLNQDSSRDGSGALTAQGGVHYYEFSHPLDTADDEHDFSLSSGDTVGFTIGYSDDGAAGIYWPTHPNTAVEYGDIVIASSPIYQGDLILNDNNVTTIEGRFDINGSIIVKGNATLILQNAVVNFVQTDGWQHKMLFVHTANGNPKLESINSTITSDYWFDIWFTGNTSATIEKSKIKAYTYVYDHSVVSILDSEIDRYLSSSGSPTVSVHNSTIKILSVHSKSVNYTINSLAPGSFKFWNHMINGSVELGSETAYAPNVTITETTVENWEFTFYGTSNVTVINSTISTFDSWEHSNLFIYDSTVSNSFIRDSSVVWFVNSTISPCMVRDQAEAYVGWYLDVHVIDSIGQDVPSSNVTAYYQNGTPFDSKSTDPFGLARFVLSEKMQNATGEYSYGNYTVEATYESYSTDTTVNMTENQQITLTLEDLVIPEFPAILILPLFMIATLLAVIVYRRKH